MSIWGDFKSILKIPSRPSPFIGLVVSVPSLVVKLNMCVCGQGRDFLWSMREPVTNFSPCYFSILIPLLCPSTSVTAQPKCALLPNPFISIRPEWLFLWWTPSLCNFMASSRRSVMLLQPPCIVEEYAIGRIKPHWNRGEFFGCG